MDNKAVNTPSEVWGKRANQNNLAVSTNRPTDNHNSTPSAKRVGSISSRNAFNSSASVASPTSASGSASFSLGNGAFGFGSASKTPKTPGSEKKDTPDENRRPQARKSISALRTTEASTPTSSSTPKDAAQKWPLRCPWVVYYRPPTGKNSDYEKSIRPMCRMETAQNFWTVYSHLKHPSDLPVVSDYHFFKEGIRPVWEDEENKRGGKWIMRLKKGVADRYWEDLLLAMIGDDFAEASDEVCGAVVSVRSGEDVFSIWTKNDGGRNVKIRETIKRVLNLPADTTLVWRSHDESINQRSAVDAAREGKQQGYGEKRRNTLRGDTDRARREEEPTAPE